MENLSHLESTQNYVYEAYDVFTCKMSVFISLIIATIVAFVIYLYQNYNYSYWKRKNVPYIPPSSFFGNLKDMVLFRKSPAEMFQDLYNNEIGKGLPFVGIYAFHQPALLIKDIELIKRILVKDFNDFSDRHMAIDPHIDSLAGYNLFFAKNPLWKTMRTNITPVFTSGKIKQMFPLLIQTGEKLDQYLCKQKPKDGQKTIPLELKDLCARYGTDTIASVAFGVQADSINEAHKDGFRHNGQELFKFTARRATEFTIFFFLPKLVPLLKLKFFTPKATDFLRSTISYVMKNRIESGYKRNDLIDILIALEKVGIDINGKNITEDKDVLVAQAAVFFTAGFETSSSLMSFSLYEMSKKPDVQERVRAEIKEVLHRKNGDITYEDINNMEYLHAVAQETLRMYPPLPFLDRACTKADGGYSLEPISDLVIPKNTLTYIPIYAIHRDPKYFPNPNDFDPTRFLAEKKDDIIPYSYMPFGTGPHNCIGERLGFLQSKIGIFSILRNHYVHPSKTAPPMKLSKKALVLTAEEGVFCDLEYDPLYQK